MEDYKDKVAMIVLVLVVILFFAGYLKPHVWDKREIVTPVQKSPPPKPPAPPTSPPPKPPAPPEGRTAVLIDDLEDGNRENEFGGLWFTYDDRHFGGDSKVSPEGFGVFKPSEDGAFGSYKCARITGRVTTTHPDGFIGMGTDLRHPNNPVDIREYNGIEFWTRGDGKTYRLKIRSKATGDYDDYRYDFVATEEWTRLIIDFEDLQQEGWGKKVSLDEALSGVISITFQTVGQPHASVELAVDCIRFLK